MPPLCKVHPLEIPEILSLIGSFISTWKDSPFGPKFVPRDLLSTTLVNTTWREAMLPYLWKVYEYNTMIKVPIELVFKYSSFFHFFQPPFYPHRSFWGNDSNGCLLLKCTRLKSYTFADISDIQSQYRLLQNNPGVESLLLYNLFSSNSARIISDTFSSLSMPVKELHLERSGIAESELFSLLDCFSHVERLHVVNVYIDMEPDESGSKALPSLASTPHSTNRAVHLEDLSFSSKFTGNEQNVVLSILRHYPTIKHLTLNVLHRQGVYIFGDLGDLGILFNIHKQYVQALAWRDADKRQQESTTQGLEELDFRGVWEDRYETRCSMRLENRSRDIVALSAVFWRRDADFLLHQLISHANCLQQLDVECQWMIFYENDCTLMHVIRQILGKLTALRHLRFIAHDGLTKEDSFSIFQGRFGQGVPLQQQEDDSSLEAAASTAREPRWACQALESLILGGLWNTASKDHLRPGQDTWTFESGSERHQWVARGATRFGKRFQGVIAQRIQAFQNLRQLTLAGVTFDYREMDESTSSNA